LAVMFARRSLYMAGRTRALRNNFIRKRESMLDAEGGEGLRLRGFKTYPVLLEAANLSRVAFVVKNVLMMDDTERGLH